ncbi:MAG: AsmA-like C-terminal region-containing protein [Verrucomicrobiota bacterium]
MDLRGNRIDAGDWHGRGLHIFSRMAGSLTNRTLARCEAQLQLDELQYPRARGRNLALSSLSSAEDATGQQMRTTVSARAASLESPLGAATVNQVVASMRHGWSVFSPWNLDWSVETSRLRTIWGEAAHCSMAGQAAPQLVWSDWRPIGDEAHLWRRLEPFDLDWSVEVRQVNAPQLALEKVFCKGQWRAPEVLLETLDVNLYGGTVQSDGCLDVISREVVARASLAFDVQKVLPLLTPKSRRWLSQFGWQSPPQASGSMRVVLPDWRDSHPRWRDEVMPTLELAGQFRGESGTFRGVPVSYAQSHFTLTNAVWHLPDLLVRRPEGEATLAYQGDMQSHDYHWKVQAQVDPKALRPLLEQEAAQRALDQFDFTVPPTVQGEVSGRWEDLASVRFQGHVNATNFTFRKETCSLFDAELALTGSSLQFRNVTVRHDTQEITVPNGSYDLTERVVYVTNAISTMDPGVVTRAIGPRIAAAFEPYHFDVPPRVEVSGCLPTSNTLDADVRFAVTAGLFRYWKLGIPDMTADVYWHGDDLAITRLRAKFYGGNLHWQGTFDFSVPVGAQMSFQGHVRNADLHELMRDLGLKTNNVQGSLDAHLKIQSANSDDWRSWQGLGQARLRDGFLWDIPIFGFFSPVFNSIRPGLGSSRVNAGDATFHIEDSVLHTSDLELKSPALRLRYNGWVDFKGAVDTRVQAEIFRDAWGIGRVLSMALWPLSKAFEYRITGSIHQPETEPVFIPKALMWPFHPWKSLKKLFTRKPRSAEAPEIRDYFTPSLDNSDSPDARN